MASETLGAHLRNLITPYGNIIEELRYLRVNTCLDLKKNLDEIIEFSKSDKMESVNWREE